MIYLVTYDLNRPGQEYDSLYNVLKSAPSWWHYLDSTWIIRTNKSVEFWNDKLKEVLDNGDNWLIVDITKQPRQGWLPKKAWEWIRENENK